MFGERVIQIGQVPTHNLSLCVGRETRGVGEGTIISILL